MSVSDLKICNLAYDGNLAAVKRLVLEDKKAVNVLDNNKRSALHWACSKGHVGVAEFLINQGSKVNNR